MRITGMATGLDMDEIIKNSMKPYRIKVDQMTQKKDIVEIKQKLYRDIIKENREFFTKHLDIAKSDSLLKASNWSSISFSSSDENAVTTKASGEAIKDNYKVSVEQLATSTSEKLIYSELADKDSISISFSSNPIEISIKDILDNNTTYKTEEDKQKAISKRINEKVGSIGLNSTYSEISKGIIIESKETGSKKGGIVISATKGGISQQLKISSPGKDLIATIWNSKGESIECVDAKGDKPGSNSVTVDGITFTFNGETCKSVDSLDDKFAKAVKITGKTDVKELKDKIVSFVNDYNKLIEKLNSTVSTRHDRSYDPLTSEQKKEMSENEVKLWNERVEKGQLYKDSDITRIANSMKEAMRTLMDSSGLKLEKIGIKPINDYSGNLNGTFTIDESKLTQALENNTQDVMNLFISKPSSEEEKTLTEEEKYNKNGILFKLKNIIDDEFQKSTSSPLLKKAGFDGTSTFSTNELSKSITDYEKRIKDMEKDFSRREQALYSKYATLEKMMNKLNAQQSNLMSQLGMG